MTNKQFFQEALLEAKTIRETALASAKASLEEAFTPKLQSMINAKLSLMEDDASDDNEMEEAKIKADEAKDMEEAKDMDEAKDMEEAKIKADEAKDMEEAKAKQEEGYGMDEANELDEMELDEILAELEREEAKEGVAPAGVPVNPLNLEAKAKADEAKKVDEKKEDVKEGEAAYEYEKGKQAGKKLGEEAEAEDEVTELTVDELKDLIRDVLADVLGSDAAAEDEMGTDEEEITVDDSEEVSDDMELETILRELDKKNEAKPQDEAKKMTDEAKKVDEKKDVDEAKKEVDEAKKETNEAIKVIKALKRELNEVNLLNAKLLYVNKIFKSKSLTESQKVKVINAFDRAESVKEVKNTYETLKESFNAAQKSTIKESVGFASKTIISGNNSKPIVEADSFVARMQKLAGIK